MIKTPLRFVEMNKEVFFPDSAKFCDEELCVTPKGFNPVDMIFTMCKLEPAFKQVPQQAVRPCARGKSDTLPSFWPERFSSRFLHQSLEHMLFYR
jgi:hypothetical protein